MRGPRGSDTVRSILLGPSRAGSRSRAFDRTVVALCAAMTALVAVVLWPSTSFAAIVPACENDFASRMAAAQGEPQESCAPPAEDDDVDNSRVAPMCDASGASSVAPPWVRAVSDQKLDKADPCRGSDALRTAVSPGRGDPPLQHSELTFERAVLPDLVLAEPGRDATMILSPARTDGPRAGIRHLVYHPPR